MESMSKDSIKMWKKWSTTGYNNLENGLTKQQDNFEEPNSPHKPPMRARH